MRYPRLAFVDVETTGLGAGLNRVAEIGVVTLDECGVTEWESLLDPGRRAPAVEHEFGAEPAGFRADNTSVAPRFADIAVELAARLDGRLLIAHNARFDYAFLKTEFDRLTIPFKPQVLCTVMLSRELYPQHGAHHLDALMERHGLRVVGRHRALPDARVLLQFWQTIQREFPARKIDSAIAALLAEPLLPAHLDLALIDALPERPGIYTFVGDDDRTLQIGRAGNLRREVKRYFHLDRDCARAAELSREVRDIRCEVIAGPLDAKLREIVLRRQLTPSKRRGVSGASVSIRIEPAAFPAATLVSLADTPATDAHLYGIFATERKATNALKKLATEHRVCHSLLGLQPASGTTTHECRECNPAAYGACAVELPRHLLRLLTGIAPSRIQPWPYRGPIAVREGRRVHVFDRWEHLGTVRVGADVPALLQQRRGRFDPDIYAVLKRALPKLAANAVRNIPVPEPGPAGPAAGDLVYERS